jgi:hypothetical protein
MSLKHSDRGQIYHEAIDVCKSALYASSVEQNTTKKLPGS